MAFEQINALQPKLVANFARVIEAGRLSAAYIFAGPTGVGKHALAVWLGASLMCDNPDGGRPCGQCAECRRVLSDNHPDVVSVRTEANSVKVDDMRALKQEMSKTGMEGQQRLFVVEEAEKLTVAAANSLLKFYEEPLPGMTIILTTNAKQKLLPTIVSRAQVIQLATPSLEQRIAQLEQAGVSAPLAAIVAHLTADFDAGVALAQQEDFEARVQAVTHWLGQWAKSDPMAFVSVQTQLMPVAKTAADQAQVLALIALALQSAIHGHYQLETPSAFNQQAVAPLAELGGDVLAARLRQTLLATQMVAANVGFQGALEQLSLHQ